MPNLKGGNGYKRKKKGTGDEDIIVIADMEEGQLFGRIIKILGNCNFLVYCEDARERICHIRGKMRSRAFVHVGDVVILSVRDFEKVEPGKLQRGDICHKYDPKHHSALRKKFPNINPDIFVSLELKKDGGGSGARHEGFEFDGEAEDGGVIEGEEEDQEESGDEVPVPEPAAGGTNTIIAPSLGGNRKKPIDMLPDNDDFNIDYI